METEISPSYIITTQEVNHRLEKLRNGMDVSKIVWTCTLCGSSVKREALRAKGALYTHPLLKTIICKKCWISYGREEFSANEDDTDKYCRWCGHGGELSLCSQCPSGFCKRCITRNLDIHQQSKVEQDGWVCFCCNSAPLMNLRTICWAAQQMIRARVKKPKRPHPNSEVFNKKRIWFGEFVTVGMYSDNPKTKPMWDIIPLSE